MEARISGCVRRRLSRVLVRVPSAVRVEPNNETVPNCTPATIERGEDLGELGAAPTWAPRVILIVLCIFVPIALFGQEDVDRRWSESIVLGELNGRVQNGSAYEVAQLDVNQFEKLFVPVDCVVKRSDGDAATINIYVEKMLCFAGHPPEEMSIHEARSNMGCAYRAKDDVLTIATFGEWDSDIEGGAYIRLVLVAPRDLIVEKQSHLSGEKSIAHPTKHVASKSNGYWYGHWTCGEEWTVLDAKPDPDHTARKK